MNLSSTIVQKTKEAIFSASLQVASAVGLNPDAWSPQDSTRSLFWFLASGLATLEPKVVQLIGSGFLDWAVQWAEENDDTSWLVTLAAQVYSVTAVEATYATTTVRLTNTKGGLFDVHAGDLTFKDSTTDKTYHNTTGGTLASGPGTTLDVTVIADEAGSASSAGATEIDTLVTTLNGVTCSNATAAIGLDAESASSIADRCRSQLGAISSNGPSDAYNAVARDSTKTGTTGITRSRTLKDSDTGDVYQYLAGPSGTISDADRDAAEAAVDTWALPLGFKRTVKKATAVVVDVTYQLWIYSDVGVSPADIETAVNAALATAFAARPIGGDVIVPGASRGYLYVSLIETTIRNVYPDHAFRVAVTAPASDVALTLDTTTGEVAVLGTPTATITPVAPPSGP